jgi:hypothetical protein
VLAAVKFELKTVWHIIANRKLKDFREVVKDGTRARYLKTGTVGYYFQQDANCC